MELSLGVDEELTESLWVRIKGRARTDDMHQERSGQQVEGGDSVPLLCSGDTPPGVLYPALEPSAQERHALAGAGPEEGQKNDPRDGTPLL